MDGVILRKENVDVLLFADDMVLIADSTEALQVNLQVRWDIDKMEMKMNWEKTEVMKVE